MAESGDGKRYRLLRDYLLANGFIGYQKTCPGQAPFVLGSDFYGWTFEDAVDCLEDLHVVLPEKKRRIVHEMAKRDGSDE